MNANLMLGENSLKGQTIIVTGGGTGLGKSMSECFLMLGANVIITSRRKEVLDEAAVELNEKTGGNILPVVCDVRKYDEVEKMMELAVSHFGSVTALVNNAAGNFISPTENLSTKAFDVVIDIVLKGTCNCSLTLGKYWIENKIPGRMLNIVVAYAFTGSGYVVPSAAAKGGVLALTRSLAAEWGKYGIRTNAIAPGYFPTEGAWERLFPEEVKQYVNLKKRVPLGRVGNHSELANLASYLISDYSSFVNGEVVVIDGGEWVKNAGMFSEMENVPKEVWENMKRKRK